MADRRWLGTQADFWHPAGHIAGITAHPTAQHRRAQTAPMMKE